MLEYSFMLITTIKWSFFWLCVDHLTRSLRSRSRVPDTTCWCTYKGDTRIVKKPLLSSVGFDTQKKKKMILHFPFTKECVNWLILHFISWVWRLRVEGIQLGDELCVELVDWVIFLYPLRKKIWLNRTVKGKVRESWINFWLSTKEKDLILFLRVF